MPVDGKGNNAARDHALSANAAFASQPSEAPGAHDPATVRPLASAQMPDTPRARMEFLRDFLKELPDERFNIAHLISDSDGRYIGSAEPEALHACGTAACIKGWSHYLFKGASKFGPAWGEELGLSEADADELFMPGAHDDRPNNYADASERYTRAAAVRVLDIYLAEQVVDWERAIAETAGATNA